MINSKKRWLSVLMMLVLVSVPFGQVHGATDIAVNMTKDEPVVFLSDEGERIFDVGYNFGVDFDAHAKTIYDTKEWAEKLNIKPNVSCSTCHR